MVQIDLNSGAYFPCYDSFHYRTYLLYDLETVLLLKASLNFCYLFFKSSHLIGLLKAFLYYLITIDFMTKEYFCLRNFIRFLRYMNLFFEILSVINHLVNFYHMLCFYDLKLHQNHLVVH